MFSIMVCFVGMISAQRGSESPSEEPTPQKTQDESRRERKRENELRRYRLTLTPLAIKRAQNRKTVVLPMEYLGESEALSVLARRDLPRVEKGNGMVQESEVEPLIELPGQTLSDLGPVVGAFLQSDIPATANALAGASFEGPGTGLAGFSLSGAPPDTTMAVGPNHIVAWVNSQYAVFSKSGSVITGPVNGNTLFSGVANLCSSTNRGDPILQYDRMADRWILSQFAFNTSGGSPAAPYLQCFAVSTTGDPSGTYYRYSLTFNSTSPDGFNDYGKLGIWNDGYYTSFNIFGGSPAAQNTGAALCVSNRAKMLVGDSSATTLCAPTTFYGGGASLLPADMDGTTLPSDLTRGGLFMRQSTAPALRYLRLKPNFTSNTVTLTDGFGGATGSFVELGIGATNRSCNGGGSTCIAQPGTTNQLDTLGDRMMYRLVYRNRGGVESLLATQSVDPDGSGSRGSAVRWYEVRNPLGDPSNPDTSKRPFIYQSGTYDPGATGDRWMSSAAMDKFGNILVGYSVANAATALKPSIAVAGRSQCDALNTLQAEQIAVTGTGSQTGSLTRWGDYSTMQIDPADDTTFWYIAEYLSADGNFNWRTRIVSYKFPTTTATASGDFNTAGNWSNGAPSAATTAIVPSGVTMTVNSPTNLCNLDVASGGSIVMNSNVDISGSLNLANIVDTSSSVMGLGCQATISGASTTAYLQGTIRKDFCSIGGFSFPSGSANGYSPVNASVTALATNPSSISVKAVQSSRSGMDPANSLRRYWTLSSAGSLTTDLSFSYLDADVAGTEANYHLFKWNGGNSTAVPFTLNAGANTISATGVSSFSDWTAGVLAPTAGGVRIAGRVLTQSGQGLVNAVVTVTGMDGVSHSTITSSLGYYSFADVPAGQSCTVSVQSKRFVFSPRIINLTDAVEGLDFTAQ
ncbi:MAG: carboxypeptidase-like regulatory domain-containing protein [Acidobacteriota bacterium]